MANNLFLKTSINGAENVKNSLRGMRNTMKDVTSNTKKMAQTNKSLGQSFRNLNKDVNRNGVAMRNLSKIYRGFSVAKAIGQIYLVGRVLAGAIESTMDMIETQNLFNVSMGSMAVATGEYLANMSAISGLDLTNLKNSVGTYALLARSMGFTNEQASKLSVNTNNLAMDLASLTNVPIAQVMGDLRSGLLGQSETVYKYGIDVTEAAIKAEAMAQGIAKSVRNMSQGEKMALRYSVMIKQTALAHGDFAKTIEEPANQIRILKERVVTLTRSLGSIFLPVLASVLPYLNALAIVLTKVLNRIAAFFGYVAPKDANTAGNLGSTVEESMNDASGAVGGATKKLKEMRKYLLGIDELNVIPENADTGVGGGGGVGGLDDSILPEMDLTGYDNMLDSIKTRADEIAVSLENAMNKIAKAARPATEALEFLFYTLNRNISPFIFGTLTDFYNEFLVPVSTWVLGDGLPRMFDAISLAVQTIDWDNLRESLKGVYEQLSKFAILTMEPLVWLFEKVLVPLGKWAIDSVLPITLDIIADAFRGINAVLDVLNPMWKSLWEEVLIPLGQWTGAILIEALELVARDFEKLADFLEENDTWIKNVTTTLGGLALAWQGVKLLSFLGQVGGLTSALQLLWAWVVKNTIAKVADKLETIAQTLMYAKDAVAKGISTAATIAGTVATKAATAATWLFNTALAVLTSPITLVIAAIAALIAIVILLIKNWDTVKEIAGKAWDWIKEKWSEAGEWFRTKVTEPIGRFFTGAWDSIKIGASNAWEGIKSVFSKVGEFFSETFSKAWGKVKDIFSTGGKIFDGIKEGIADAFKAIVNRLIRGINTIVAFPFNAINGMLNKIRSTSFLGISPFKSLWSHNPINVPEIPQLARGGFVDGGGLFQAGEFGKAEMIGNYGGKTTVMPLENTDFVSAMYDAIYSATIDAMSQNGGSDDKEIILRMNEYTLGKATIKGINRVTRQDGKLGIEGI